MLQLLESIQPLLKLAGIDPAALANKLGREQLQKRLERVIPAVVKDLEKNGLTPAKAVGHPDTARQLVRSAMYQIFKRAVALPKGGNLIADGLRDHYDDSVVARVIPQLRVDMTAAAAVGVIVRETIEHIL